MKINRRTVLTGLLLIHLGVVSPGVGAQPVPARDRVVLVISLDGFPAWKLEDPRLPIPTLRRLAAEGSTAAGMRVCNPTFTWPSHTTMATGVWPLRHGVLHNGLLVREGDSQRVREDAKLSGAAMIRVPTIYDVAHRAGLTTAQVVWPLAMDSGSITWAFNEFPQPDGKVERQMIQNGLLQPADLDGFMRSSPVWRDQIWTRAASYILSHDKPNLMLVHLLNVDANNHRYGPDGWASYSAFAYLDECVRKVLDAAPKDRPVTVLVVSDHGFRAVQRNIRPNVVLKEHGFLKVLDGKVRCDAYAVPEGGTAMVYITNPKADRPALLSRLRQVFLGTEGVDRVILPSEFHALGMPTPEENNQMADFVVTAKNGYAFWPPDTDGPPVADTTEKDLRGHHAYLNDDPNMNSIFIASGYRIRHGTRLPVIDSVDVAPTLADLLGIRMGSVDGKALTGILQE